MAAVEVSHLGKTFARQVCAIDNLTLDVREAELLVLMGPSGCGKTTTLRLIAGLERPTSGQIAIHGRAVDRLLPRERDVAMVFQQGALFPHLTVRGNLGFGLSLRGTPKSEIGTCVDAAAQVLGICDLLERRPGELSGGQQQRVALGRAIVRRPKLFLMDEPLSSLDAALRRQLRQELRQLHARLGIPMIYVTHDEGEAMALGQRIAILREGRLQQAADPQTLYEHPANRFVAASLGNPGINFFEGQVERSDRGVEFAISGDVRLRMPDCLAANIQRHNGKPITLGIRPEHLSLGTEYSVPSRPTCVQIPAIIEAVERLGTASHVYLQAGAQSFIAHIANPLRPAVGERVVATASAEHLHFFDPATERAIHY